MVTGIEALARWPDPLRGMVSPSEFVPLAERTGLIGDLTDLVLELAIQHAGMLRNCGHAIDLAVNLSPLILVDPEAPDRLSRMLTEHRVENYRFVVEITESAAMADGTLTMENLTRFRLKDMKLSMDDFGTGYSSLVQLYRMPFNELKIDKSFVMEVDAKEEARVIVRSIIDLAHNLNLTVCAEGVETPETLDFLRSIGCDQAQGYLISKPLDETGLARFLESHAPNRATAIVTA
jgi:EAL domain-containing protein (putative c-di-GMP-specific phosphodiesterase class I)